MQLHNEFRVPASPSVTFATLSDLERIAPCMPGAVLDERIGDEYLGRVAVRIGPVGLWFSGSATVLERDLASRRLVVRGSAKDRSGRGGAQALITMTVSEDGTPAHGTEASSSVQVVTELDLSGKVAQFGGAAINQVNRRLIEQFVQRLDAMIRQRQEPAATSATGAGALVPHATGGAAGAVRQVLASCDLRHAGAAVAATVAAGALLGVAVSRALRSAGAREDGLQLDGGSFGQ